VLRNNNLTELRLTSGLFFNPLSAKKSLKVKVTLCQRVSRLSTSPFLITFQLHSLVLSDMHERVMWHLKG